jgi:uncharacterized membrane protein YhaH (DUF805 family)
MWEYYNLEGRRTRMVYWRTLLLCAFAFAIIKIASVMFPLLTGVAGFGQVVWLATLPVSGAQFSNIVERLHDRGKSGWWIVPFWVAPSVVIGVAYAGAAGNAGASLWVTFLLLLVGLGLGLWGLVELGFLRGTRGENQYGPDSLPV